MKWKHYNRCMVRKDILDFKKTIPSHICLVAATKYLNASEMKDFLNAGINNFGENRVEAFLEKYDALKNEDVHWHFIGHLQRNKALKVIDKIEYLHSLDSLKLAKIINDNVKTPLKCFIEVSINLEITKNGVPFYDVDEFYKNLKQYPNIKVVGLMMMAIKNSDDLSLKEQFKKLRILRDELESKYNEKIPYLSMGMSDDYLEAIEEGATHIRLGRILLEQ